MNLNSILYHLETKCIRQIAITKVKPSIYLVKSIKEGLEDHSDRKSIVADHNKKSRKTNKNRTLSAASRVDTKNPK